MGYEIVSNTCVVSFVCANPRPLTVQRLKYKILSDTCIVSFVCAKHAPRTVLRPEKGGVVNG